ncbi:MAG: S-layer homology domain-containing protein [Lachnospiraceae bacterium]|nr:S-layer homology domain-containing protein [Lachnospiraceae bacterium]
MKFKFLKRTAAALFSVLLTAGFIVTAYASEEAVETIPEAAEVGGQLYSYGVCGEDTSYTWNETTGELVISGNGKIESDYNYNKDGKFCYNQKIKSVIIKEGITQIGSYCFRNSTNIRKVVIPKSCTLIGSHAFYKLSNAEFYYNGTREQFWNIKILQTNREILTGKKHYNTGKEHLFSDVTNKSSYFYYPVEWAATKKITTGVGDGTNFEPSRKCTRAMIVTLLYRLAGSPKVNKTGTFKDVPKGSWYHDAVYWAVEKKITTGYGNGTFQPNTICSRAMLVTFLHRYYNGGKYDSVIWGYLVPDVPSGSWYFDSVHWAYFNSQIATGKGDGLFHPNDPCTRGEAMTFLFRLMNEGNSDSPFDQTLD